MDQELVQDLGLHGLISLVISVVVTYGVHMIIPSGDVQWALIAVAIAAFFSSASTAYVKEQE
jgi:p-aminobenzoyl-glutamate transporter AbgT